MTREAGQGSGSSERIGGYDQFISLLFYVLQIIYVSYIHLCCFICSNDFIISVLSYYNMLYLFVLILQLCCLCFYLFIFNCSVSLHAYYIYMIHMLCVGSMLRRRRSCRKKRLSAEAVCMRWPKVPLHEASVLQTDLKLE
jgi:hypothetical protein